VNGKGLETRVRLPPGLERVEQSAKQAIQKRFTRGNVQASLTVARGGSATRPVVNEVLLEELARLAQRLQERFGCAPATADGLLALRGVLEIPELAEDEAMRTALDKAILFVIEEGLAGLEQSRRAEGAALSAILLGQIAAIEHLVLRAEADPSRDPAMIRERIAGQVMILMDAAGATLDEARLHMEAALLATKADIREEIDRLKAHVAAARRMIEDGGAVGRRLDFLAQEFNREANTLCAKAQSAPLTAIGLDLKAVIDQMREQIQNVE
jgi:uncharacterized protein (TIGR00255 family)